MDDFSCHKLDSIQERKLNHQSNNGLQSTLKRHSSLKNDVNYNTNNIISFQDKTSCLSKNSFSEVNTEDKSLQNINENQRHPDISNNFFEGKVNHSYLEFLWKIDLLNKNLFNNYIDIQTHTSREGMKYLIGLVYIYNKIKGNATVIFAQKLENEKVNEIDFSNAMSEVKSEFEKEFAKEKYVQIPTNNSTKIHTEQKSENNNFINSCGCEPDIYDNDVNYYLFSNTNKDNSERTDNLSEKKYIFDINECSSKTAYINSELEEETLQQNMIKAKNDEFDKNNSIRSNNSISKYLMLVQQNTKNNLTYNQSEDIIKNIISNNPNLFHNQYLQASSNKNKPSLDSNSNTQPCYHITINFLSPKKNISDRKISNIFRPSKIILTFFVIENIFETSNYLTILIRNKIDKLKEFSNKHIGLINEGMTCYMNSMIQSLNAISYFKRGIFSIPYDNSDKSLSFSLQQLFYELTFGNEPVSTIKLIQSFGWNQKDIFTQQDIQEFNMMFSDLIKKELKGTTNEEVFRYLFEGKIFSKIECVNYQYKSIKEENFNDLQLNVKGCKNIYESFTKYTEKEMLDEEDKYEVEGHGKEKAIKSTIFSKFPPVLILQLKRFEYNPKLGSMDKLNDYFEFYDTIDLSQYFKNKDIDNKYKLLSVVVHQGNIYGGHYYAYTRFDVSQNEWFCFNDKIVYKADLYEVFETNFGGNSVILEYKQDTNSISEIEVKSNISAYVLIYIQTSKAQEILKPLTIEEIPIELVNQIKNEKCGAKRKSALKLQEDHMINVFYLNESMLRDYHGLGIGRGIPKSPNQEDTNIHLNKTIKEESLLTSFITIPRTTTVQELYTIFKNITNLSLREISLFLVVFTFLYEAKTFNFTMHFLEYDNQLTVENIMCELSGKNERPKRLVIYLDNSSIKNYEPIIHQTHSYDPSKYLGSENHSLDEKKIQINEKISIYIPNYNPYIFNNFYHQSLSFKNYKRKILLYKVLTSTNDFTLKKTLNVCVNEKGAIEQNSIINMKTIEKEFLTYYIKLYNISNETLQKVGSFGITYFVETRSMKWEMSSPDPIPFENLYIMSYNKENFESTYVDQNIMHLISDFNETFFQNRFTDCLLIIPIFYIGSQLIGLKELFDKLRFLDN